MKNVIFGHREEMKRRITVGRKGTVQKNAITIAVTANNQGKPDDVFLI